jgi:hypothetical protein
MFVHYYMVENYRKVPILLNLQKIIEGGGSNEVNIAFLKQYLCLDLWLVAYWIHHCFVNKFFSLCAL